MSKPRMEIVNGCAGDSAACDTLREVHRMVSSTDGKLDKVLGSLNSLTQHTHHLEKLDVIATGINSLNENLVGPATGRKQVPLGSHILTILILGAVIVLLVVVNVKSNVEMSPTKLKIDQAEAKQ